ncbi:MAG: histidine kinase [Burkholderiaceae bacterium]|jgi:signal transduction histidine kinase|nr:histidine kinase [Burkholderiaceae bacterium]MCU0963897.1 histidine kinase [Burkholderiaceae bacterium]
MPSASADATATALNGTAPVRRDWRALVAWPRVKLWLIVTLVWALMRTATAMPGLEVWLIRCGLVTAVAVLAFGMLEQWPRRLPRRLPRWVAQLLAVAIVIPPAAFAAYALTLGTWDIHALGPSYSEGFSILAFMGVLFGPWIALVALLRQREAFAREQALAFALERSELERRALDARMKLLQAQVEPHFLFNTLANVRTLVRRAGSQQASAVLDGLIHYLRAAVPRLDGGASRFADERALVQAYLEVMHLRMPDRLQFAIDVDEATLALHCPAAAVLTLVENAIRHGIDPAEEGGRIEVTVRRVGDRVQVRVADTGIGLGATRGGRKGEEPAGGTGLANLRERLALAFGGDATLALAGHAPRGTVATLDLPATPAPGP